MQERLVASWSRHSDRLVAATILFAVASGANAGEPSRQTTDSIFGPVPVDVPERREPAVSESTKVFHLDAYVAEVEARNPSALAARRRVDAATRRIGPAGAWEDPFVAVGPDGLMGASGDPRVVRYQVSQPVPFPGKLSARSSGAEERARSAGADADTVARSVRVVAVQTFLTALLNQRAIELNEELRALVREAVDSGRARYRTGDPNHHEWLLAKAELGLLASERVRLDNEHDALRASLNELRDVPLDTPIGRLEAELPRAGRSEPLDAGPSLDSPELESLDALVLAADAEERAAALAYFPDLVVQGMVEQPRHGPREPMWGLMVGVSLPVFWSRKQDELLAAARAERAAALEEKRSLENRLRVERINAERELDTALRTVELYEEVVIPATELAQESSRAAYVVGRVHLGEFLSVARARRVQELEYLGARIDVVLSRTRLEEILSTPPVLRLAPAMPTLFGAGMGGAMPAGMARRPMPGPSAIRMGPGMGLGAARGESAPAAGASMPGMGGM